jgi:cell division transport system permease protein
MKMRFRIFKNMMKQGLQGMWRNRGMGLASVGSISAVLIILGIVLIMVLSINNLVSETTNKFDELQVFLEDDLEIEQLNNIEKNIKGTEGVVSAVFLSKDEALEDFKKDWGENASLLEGLDPNPLQNSYVIKLKNIEYADNVVDKVNELEGVDEVKYYKDII